MNHKTERTLGHAQQFARAGNWDRVVKEVELNIVRPLSDEEHGRMLAHMARAYFRQGRKDAAQYYAERALDLIPDLFQRRDDERGIANAVLRELEWEHRYPKPSIWQQRRHELMRWIRGDLVYRP